jgi:glycosidase
MSRSLAARPHRRWRRAPDLRRAGLAAALIAALAGCAAAAPPPQSAAAPAAVAADPYAPRDISGVRHPEWARDAVIYQINTRQFTPEGTFRAAMGELPRLQQLGVDILWLMPIHPIGVQNRKGTLGSPYSVRDFYGVNPEFGTLEDFRAFLAEAHRLDMRVIIDWVANHSSWDNPLTLQHPEWYERDWQGRFRSTPWWDWTDIIDFDYDQVGIRRYMAEAMLYWVRDVGVDGFRADVAGYVPIDFWEQVRRDLDAVRPVFMLGEFEQRDLHRAFDATYAWSWNRAVHQIAQGKADVGALFGYYSENESAWPRGAMRMKYVTNHDQNSWEGTEFERFGPALTNAIVLSFVGEGIPLIYNGAEAGNAKRLEFFERDPIRWREHPNGTLFRRLIALKTDNRALWNAPWGARMVHVPNDDERHVLSFHRAKDGHALFAAINFSAAPREVTLGAGPHHGRYRDWDTGEEVRLEEASRIRLAPWSYRLLTAY